MPCSSVWPDETVEQHARARLAFYNFFEPGVYRLMCSWATTEEQLDALVADFAAADDSEHRLRPRRDESARTTDLRARGTRSLASLRDQPRLILAGTHGFGKIDPGSANPPRPRPSRHEAKWSFCNRADWPRACSPIGSRSNVTADLATKSVTRFVSKKSLRSRPAFAS